MTRHIINIYKHLDPKYGGVNTSVPAFCLSVPKDAHFQERILAFSGSGESCGEDIPVSRISPGPGSLIAFANGVSSKQNP